MSQEKIYEGKVIQKGLFFSILNDIHHPDDKLYFVKNFLYSQLLPNDIILYTIHENNNINIIKINYRKPFQTVAIYTGFDDKTNKYFFFTPLLTQNFNCYIYNQNSNIPLTLNHRYIIQIHRDYNTLIADYGHIDLRINDHLILNDIYTNKWSDHIPTYNLQIQKGEFNNFYTKEYQNLEHLHTFNIDPTNSKDFDDALSFDEVSKKIYVHIVDANQLHLGSFVEKRAAHLALTFYNHIQNANMLPSNLSENAFSLLRGKKRNVITVEFAVDESVGFNNGKLPILYYEIYPSTIVVKKRYDYDNVLDLANTCNTHRYLKGLCDKYYQRRLNIVQPSYKIDHNNGELQEIYYENMNTWSHTLIEMMMINANRIVTEHMNKVSPYKIPQRIHPEPISLNLENMITGDELIDSIIMIQKYRTASYNKDEHGHYGLNLEHYTHFTSPIRRYNDVIVMRMIHSYIYDNLDTLLDHINKRESLNSDFEKIYKRWKLLGYLNKNREVIYEAYVTNVTKFGIKFYIKEIGFDGFLLNKYLPTLEKNRKYELGEKIKLKCNYVNYTSFEDVKWSIV